MTKNKESITTIFPIFILLVFISNLPLDVYGLPRPELHEMLFSEEARESSFIIASIFVLIILGITIKLLLSKNKKNNLGTFKTIEARKHYLNNCDCNCHNDDTLKIDNSCENCHNNKKPCRGHDV